MGDFIDYLDGVIQVFTPEGSAFPRFGSIYFFIIFLIIYSISYASTSFIPMFKNDKERNFNNIRLLISLSIAFLGSTASFMFIVGWIQFIGQMLIIGFIVSLAIIAILPKKVRENAAVPAGVIGIFAGLIFAINTSGYNKIYTIIYEWYLNNWQWNSLILFGILSFGGIMISSFLRARNVAHP